MVYEVTVSYTNSEGKFKKESYIIENALTFTDVETILYREFDGEQNFEVLAIKRSNAKEIANKSDRDTDSIWVAELAYTFYDERTEAEKTTKYKVLFFSETYDSAHAFISEYVKQGYDLGLVGLKLTRFKGMF